MVLAKKDRAVSSINTRISLEEKNETKKYFFLQEQYELLIHFLCSFGWFSIYFQSKRCEFDGIKAHVNIFGDRVKYTPKRSAQTLIGSMWQSSCYGGKGRRKQESWTEKKRE